MKTAASQRPTVNSINAFVYIAFGACILLYLSSFLFSSTEPAAGNAIDEAPRPQTEPATTVPSDAPEKLITIQQQPTTSALFRITNILPCILEEFVRTKIGCLPEDVHNAAKHQIPAKPAPKNEDAKSALVVYVAVALLLMSLGATLLDVCKAKRELTQVDSSRKKAGLTRRCSLADLTVLRHNRKELLKKESFSALGNHVAEQHVAGKHCRINRPPLRLD